MIKLTLWPDDSMISSPYMLITWSRRRKQGRFNSANTWTRFPPRVLIWTRVSTWSLSQFWSASVDRSSSESVCFLCASWMDTSGFCLTWVRYRLTSETTAFFLQRNPEKWKKFVSSCARCRWFDTASERTSGWFSLRRTCHWNLCWTWFSGVPKHPAAAVGKNSHRICRSHPGILREHEEVVIIEIFHKQCLPPIVQPYSFFSCSGFCENCAKMRKFHKKWGWFPPGLSPGKTAFCDVTGSNSLTDTSHKLVSTTRVRCSGPAI